MKSKETSATKAAFRRLTRDKWYVSLPTPFFFRWLCWLCLDDNADRKEAQFHKINVYGHVYEASVVVGRKTEKSRAKFFMTSETGGTLNVDWQSGLSCKRAEKAVTTETNTTHRPGFFEWQFKRLTLLKCCGKLLPFACWQGGRVTARVVCGKEWAGLLKWISMNWHQQDIITLVLESLFPKKCPNLASNFLSIQRKIHEKTIIVI